MDLDDVLSDKPAEKPEPMVDKSELLTENVPEADRVTSSRKEWQAKERAEREAGDRARDEQGKFVKDEKTEVKAEEKKEPEKQEAKPEVKEPPKETKPPEQDFTPRERAFLAKAQEELRKRQDLEKRIAALEKPAEQPKPFVEDPDGALNRHQQTYRSESERMLLRVADMVGEAKYPDYAQKRDVFMKLCESQPAYVEQLLRSENPAAFAYSVGKQIIDRYEWEQAGGAEGMRAKLEKEIRESLAKEQAEKKPKEQEEAPPPSLSLVRTVGGGQRRAAWGGPSSLEEILK